MILQLTLSPELEERLRQEAERRGQSGQAVVLQLLEQYLPPPPMTDERRAAAIAMLQKWMEEDAAATPEDEAEAEEFFKNLDAARTSDRPLFPPELKGITW